MSLSREQQNLELIITENKLIQEQLAVITQENAFLLQRQQMQVQTNQSLTVQNALLTDHIAKLTEQNDIIRRSLDLTRDEIKLLREKNSQLRVALDFSTTSAEEQINFDQDLLSECSHFFTQNEETNHQIMELREQLISVNKKIEEQGRAQNEKNAELEERLKNEIHKKFEVILNSQQFEDLTKKIEARLSIQIEQDQHRIDDEIRLLEARHVEWENSVEPLVDIYKQTQAKLRSQQEILINTNTKLFYQTVYKHIAAKLIAAVVLFSELVKYEERKTDKFGKLGASLAGSLFDGVPGGSIVGTIVNFSIEQSVSGVKGYFQQKKIKKVMNSMPDPSQTMEMAEAISRGLTLAYKSVLLKAENNIENLAENSARAIYHFIKFGGLDEHADEPVEYKVQIVVENLRQGKIIENNVQIPELDQYLLAESPSNQTHSSPVNIQFRQRLESVASKEELTRNSLEFYSSANRRSLDGLSIESLQLKEELNKQKEANQANRNEILQLKKQVEAQQKQITELQRRPTSQSEAAGKQEGAAKVVERRRGKLFS